MLALPDLAFAALLALGIGLVMAEMHGLSFNADEWDFIVDRRGTAPKVLLTPHGAHLSLVPILVYKAMLQIFGMGSYAPYKALAAVDLGLLALAVGLLARRRWGPWWGLAPVALLVTLGPAAATLLFPFQVGVIVATVAGIIALVAAAHGGRAGDVLACVALCVSLASGSQGVGALVGAAVVIALAPGRLRRAWVIAIPALLYGLWYLKYGQQYNETHLSLWTSALSYSMQALSSTLSALAGLAKLDFNPVGPINPSYGQPLALALLITIGVALWRGWRPPRIFWGAAATLIVVWVAAAMSPDHGARPPESTRYLPTDAAFLFVAATTALPRPRTGVRVCVLVCATLAFVMATNAGEFPAYRSQLSAVSASSRAALGALLVARGVVAPDFNPGSGLPTQLDNVSAEPFFSAVDSFGTNAYTVAELLGAPEDQRELADGVLVRAERMGYSPAPPLRHAAVSSPTLLSGPAQVSGGCLLLDAAPVIVSVARLGVRIYAPPHQTATAAMARFGRGFAPGGSLGDLAPGAAAEIRLPPDHAPGVPWRVSVSGSGARVCGL